MLDWNFKTWGLIFIIALGVTFEVLKMIPESKSWNNENLTVPAFKPYALNRHGRTIKRQAPALLPPPKAAFAPVRAAIPAAPPMTKEMLAKLVAGQAGKPQSTEFEEGKKKAEDEFEIVIDPKTGKMVKKKKKKKKVAKKKEEEKKKEEPKKAEQEVAQEPDEDSDSTENDIDAAITATLTTGKLAPLPKNKPDSPFESAEEWIKRLLSRPNLAETNRFIDHYRKNLVTSEVFFKVVGMMLEDSRAEMKKLGIHAAGAVPTVLSFQMLVGASSNARNDASVKTKAEEVLKSYTQTARLPILKTVLKSGTPVNSAIKAAHLVKLSAEQNLKVQASNQTNPQAQARNQAAYQALVPILNNLAQNASDPGLKSAASETKTALESLLSGTGSTAVAQQ